MSTPANRPDAAKGFRLPGRRRVVEHDATQVAPVRDETQLAPQRTAAHTQAAPQRERVGRFEIVERIGEGGMGVVYRAIDTHNPRGAQVALKVLRAHIAYDNDARTRLAREVSTLERVSHPNIAAVIDADPYGERPYIATEYVPGQPLQKVIDEGGKFSPEQLANLGHDLAESIDAIHAVGVVHRDIKPSNVLMVGQRPVLIDFGIAHIADDARLTSTGLVMGTPGYLSPEVVEGAPVGNSTDWWGWAATLAYAAQGEPPFGRGPMTVVLDRVTRGQAKLGGVDERLRPLLAAALSPVPHERPSARQVIEQMGRYARGESTTIVPVREVPATTQMPAADATRVQPVERSQPAAYPHGAPTQGAYHRQASPQPVGHSGGFAGAGYAPVQAQPSGSRPVDGAGSSDVRLKPQSRPGEHDPRIGMPMRSGALSALFFGWVALTALVPVTGLIVLIAWNIAARFSDFTLTQAVLRRYHAGRRKTDGAVAVASSPVHLVRAMLSTLLALLLPILIFVCVVAIIGVATGSLTNGVPRSLWAVPIIPGAALAHWSMWRGAASTGYRRGSRSLMRSFAPSDKAAKIVAGVLCALGVFMFLGSYMQGGEVSWAPLVGGITDPLSKYLPN